MRYFISCFLTIILLSACTSNPAKPVKPEKDLQNKPSVVVLDFLSWYRDSTGRLNQINFINNCSGLAEEWDSTKFYSINFTESERYLRELDACGFLSKAYINSRRAHIKECDEYFKAEPQNDGPPVGLDCDEVLYSHDYEYLLENLDKAVIIKEQIKEKKAVVIIGLIEGRYEYRLSKEDRVWKIDSIKPLPWLN